MNICLCKSIYWTFLPRLLSSATRPSMIAKDINTGSRMDIVFNNNYSGLINFGNMDFKIGRVYSEMAKAASLFQDP